MTAIRTEAQVTTIERSIRRLRTRKITLPQLVAATYLMVAGGPYGLEEIVGQAGYTGAILILLLTPLIWSMPTALLVSELSSALPESGGYYAWVKRALGPFWGFQEAWLSLLASVFDMAIYPTLFTLYLARLFPALGEGTMPIVAGGCVIAVCAAVNLRGAGAVGISSVFFTLALLSPFAVVIWKAWWLPAVPARAAAAGNLDLLGGILIAMWNYMGWDNSSTVAGEVDRPERTYPLAMTVAVVLVALTYVLPILAVRHLGIAPSEWSTGSWAGVARAVAGPWLEIGIIVGGMLSALGMLNALILSYTRIPPALAQDGYLPAIFARRNARTGAPTVSIVVCAIGWGLALNLGFERLIELDLLLYGLSLILEFVALFVLRIREPALPRPYRVPGGLAGAALLGVAPTTLIVLALIRNGNERVGPVSALAFGLALVAAGCLVYVVSRLVLTERCASKANSCQATAGHGGPDHWEN
ncbi:MAG: APC family permease [Isosphaeraceae bacterium]